jgi:hypothetical protein
MQVTMRLLGASLLLGLALWVAACAAPAPTATPVPPTAVPTTVPTTAVPPTTAPSSSSTGNDTLAQAMTKAKEATTYRVNLNITGKGSFTAAGGPTPSANAPDQPVTLVTMRGEVNDKNAHFVVQGLLTAFLGIDANQPFEIITYEGDGYVKGPIPLVGATEAKWYKAPPQAAQIVQPPLTPSSFLGSFGDVGISLTDFKLTGSESLDTQTCQVFAGDKSAVVNAFSRLGGATGATQEDLDSIDSAEFKFWVCGDGYLHQVKMAIEGHDKTDATQKGSFEFLMQMSDFNGDITITPPADAELLQLPTPAPQQPQVTPTP